MFIISINAIKIKMGNDYFKSFDDVAFFIKPADFHAFVEFDWLNHHVTAMAVTLCD